MALEQIKFQPNSPVDLSLKWTDGKNMQGQFGPSVMFTTADNRVMFLPQDVGDRVRALGLQPGEPLRICKSQGAGKKTEWQVQKLGEQGNGTFVIPKAGPEETMGWNDCWKLARFLRQRTNPMSPRGFETLTRSMFSEQSLQKPRMDDEDACSNRRSVLDAAAEIRELQEILNDENW